MWPLLAVGTALLYALHGAWSTRISRRIGALPAAWALYGFSFPVLALYLAIRGLPVVDPGFWPTWSAAAAGHLLASYLFFSALRTGELSLTFPLLALTPIFVPAVEWVLLDELPGVGGLSGIALTVAGVYLLNLGSIEAGIFAPLLALARDGPAVRTLAVAVIWSVTGTMDRVAVLDSSPAFYGAMLTLALMLLSLPFAVAGTRPRAEAGGSRRLRAFRSRLRGAGRGGLLIHGALFAFMLILQMEALTLTLASYILSIKRTGTVVAVLLGSLAFREGGLRDRLVGTIVTLAGTLVLVLFG